MAKPKPGNIQMHKGKWRIYTQRKGFQPQWEQLDSKWMVKEMRRQVGGLYKGLGSLVIGWAHEVEKGRVKQVKAAIEALKRADIFVGNLAWMGDWIQYLNYIAMQGQIKSPSPKN